MSLNYIIKNGKKIYKGKGLDDTVVEIRDYADEYMQGSGMISKGSGLFPDSSSKGRQALFQPPIKSDPGNINRVQGFIADTPLSQTDNGFDIDIVDDFKRMKMNKRGKKPPKNAKLTF